MSERRAKQVRRLARIESGEQRQARLPKHAPEPDLIGWWSVPRDWTGKVLNKAREKARRMRQCGS
jgi:hypothetical protein